jgi:hypothetical protein
MKYLIRGAVFAVAVGIAGIAQAQLPFPLPGEPAPDISKRPQCTKAYVQSVLKQLTGLETFRTAGPDAVGYMCSLVEMGSNWLGGEFSDATRKQLKDTLGFDIDLRLIRTQCRVSQGNLDRELMTQIGYLKSELVRCNDTI